MMTISFSDFLELLKYLGPLILVPAFVWVKKYMSNSKEHRKNVSVSLQKLIINVDEIKATVNTLKIMEEANFELSPLPLFVCDSRGLCFEVNESLLRIFKADNDDMYEYGWLSFIHPEDMARVKANWEEGINNKSNKLKDSYRVIDRNTRLSRNPKVIAHLFSKTILKYDSKKELKIAVGTVWSIDSQSNEDKIDCILNTWIAIKKTGFWKTIQDEIDLQSNTN